MTRIAELTRALFAACAEHGLQLELVIVDDNSPDGTGAVADELAREYRVRVIHRSGKLGLGTAVVAGFAAASADIVGVMDADFSHPPALVPRMLATLTATERRRRRRQPVCARGQHTELAVPPPSVVAGRVSPGAAAHADS